MSHPLRPHPVRIPPKWTISSTHCPIPYSKLAPTHATHHDPETNLHWAWNSRAHRKGAPALPITFPEKGEDEEKMDTPIEKKKNLAAGWKVRRRRVRWWGWDFNDISWWVAFLFTLGSIWWCIQGIIVFCYFDKTSAGYTNTSSAMAFLGGTTFMFGSWLGWVESLNPPRDAEFEWEKDEATKTLIEPEKCHKKGKSLGKKRIHFGKHHKNEKGDEKERSSAAHEDDVISSASSSTAVSRDSEPAPAWRWYGIDYSIAYFANTIQLIGAVPFQISVLVGLPGILPVSGTTGGPEQTAASEGLWISLYWAMQVIGSPPFFFAGLLFCLEVQKKWYKPNFWSLGWQIGLWNAIGAVGFFLSGLFGIWRQSSIGNPEYLQYWGTAFSTFWGSWAFLLGSYIQMWETLNKRS